MSFTASEVRGFAEAAQSLKLYRRAELVGKDGSSPLIDKLYVDPLQNESVLETMLRPNTTFVVGRKGTGKSTVFQRAQHEIRRRDGAISAYIDIKTVYESASVDPDLHLKISALSSSFSESEVRRLLLYRAFTRAVFVDIQSELKKQINASFLNRLKEAVSESRSNIVRSIDDLLAAGFEADVTDITAFETKSLSDTTTAAFSEKLNLGANVKAESSAAGVPSGAASLSSGWEQGIEANSSSSENFSKILLRTFNVTGIMERLQKLLSAVGVRRLYVFIDDFSELPQEAMTVFVDTVLAPLNNWSNELIKFKVASYPGRTYYGQIDPTKIDEIHLDTYHLYGVSDVSSMEEKAIDFTRRLLNSRFEHFLSVTFERFCEGDAEEICRQLFYASMGNPRILGHVLHNLSETQIGYGRGVGVRAVHEAASRYYGEKVEPFFGMQKFVHETFDERSSVFSLKELLESLVSRARELRDYKASTVTRDIAGRTPSSHFYLTSQLESLLSTLELNFFVTKYFEMKDRDGRSVSVYALNYGLCVRYGITFGRPSGRREHRLYFVERIFDYSGIIRKYLKSNQEIRCSDCGTVHGLEKLDSIRLFGMMCPACRVGTCTVANLSRRYENVLRTIDPELLLPATELGILETLYAEEGSLGASEIAGELDCSYQLVGKRGKIMSQRGLVDRSQDKGRRIFTITDRARAEYFDANEDRQLNIPEPR